MNTCRLGRSSPYPNHTIDHDQTEHHDVKLVEHHNDDLGLYDYDHKPEFQYDDRRRGEHDDDHEHGHHTGGPRSAIPGNAAPEVRPCQMGP